MEAPEKQRAARCAPPGFIAPAWRRSADSGTFGRRFGPPKELGKPDPKGGTPDRLFPSYG